MRIEKVINNNIIQARDNNGVELVVMGRGIGFGKGPGSEIDSAAIEKTFRLDNMDDSLRSCWHLYRWSISDWLTISFPMPERA